MTPEIIAYEKELTETLWAKSLALFVKGDHTSAREVLVELIVRTIGFTDLGKAMGKSPAKLMRMLSPGGCFKKSDLKTIIKTCRVRVGIDPVEGETEAERQLDWTLVELAFSM